MNWDALIKAELDAAKAIEEKGEMTAEDLAKYEGHLEKAAELTEQKKRFEAAKAKAASFEAPLKRKSTQAAPSASVEVKEPEFVKDPMKGFSSPKDFFKAIMDANASGKVSENLRFLAAAGTDEQSTQVDPYGGFLVPEAMSPDVKMVGADIDPSVGRTMNLPMGSPTIKVNARVDKNHSTSVSGGLTVSRRAERSEITSSRMELEQVTLGANSLAGLSYVTEELLSDSPVSVAALIGQGFKEEFASHLLNEKLNGSGVGEFEGVLKSPALITVAKETSQDADTILIDNITKMYARLWGKSNGIWMANHDTFSQLAKIGGDSNGNGQLVWMNSSENGSPAKLLGLPIFFNEYMETLGDKGDILLVNWSQYLTGMYQPLQTAESIEVRFVENERAFRFLMRNDARSWWRSPLTPKKGATMSPFVTLAARA